MPEQFPWLTTMIVVPLLGAAVVWALPGAARRFARPVAVGVSLLVLLLGVLSAFAFDRSDAGTHQLLETHAWIPAIGASYAVGVDGVGLALVLLSVVLTPLVLLAAWREQPDVVPAQPGEDDGLPTIDEGGSRIRTYVALVLVLEAFMVAVFAARDVFFFYVLFEAMLIPVYFMIGMFGGLQRRYAAVKFLLFSLAGGLVMLVGVIALYLQGPRGPQGFLTMHLTGLELPVTTERLLFLAFRI